MTKIYEGSDIIFFDGKYCSWDCESLKRGERSCDAWCNCFCGGRLAQEDDDRFLRTRGCLLRYGESTGSNDENNLKNGETTMKDTIGSAVQSVVAGVKAGGANAVNKKLIKILRDSLGEKYPAFFNDGLGKMLEPILAPTLVMLIADSIGDSKLQGKITKTCKLALTGCGVELVGQMQDKHGEIASIVAAIAAIADD
jgi:hypothetical protein